MSKLKVSNRTYEVESVGFDKGVLFAIVYDVNAPNEVPSKDVPIMTRAGVEAYFKAQGWPIDEIDNYNTADFVHEFSDAFKIAIERQFAKRQRQTRNGFLLLFAFVVALHVAVVIMFGNRLFIAAPAVWFIGMIIINRVAHKLKFI